MKTPKFNIKKLLQKEKGAITIFVGLAMVAIMGMASLVTDLGMVYITANRVQNAADAGALAAANDFPLADNPANRAAVKTVVQNYAKQNGVDPSKVTIKNYETSGGQIIGVEVSGEATQNNGLIKMISKNNDSTNVTRNATAGVKVKVVTSIGTGNGISGLIPIGLSKTAFSGVTGTSIDLGADPSNKDSVKYAYMNFKSNGNADTLKEWMAKGYPNKVSVGDTSDFSTGSKSADAQAYNARYDACDKRVEQNVGNDKIKACTRPVNSPLCTVAKHEESCPRLALVPIFEQIGSVNETGNGANKNYDFQAKIVGFAQIFIENYGNGGNDKNNKMNATFIKNIDISDLNVGTDGSSSYLPGQDYIAKTQTVKLTK